MRSVGDGSLVWRVRVDLFADDSAAPRVEASAKSLASLLTDDGNATVPCDCSADGGTGIAARPVIGLLFWVRADDVGSAAATAVQTAMDAGAALGVGPDLYDVTVIPQSAVAAPAWMDADRYPPMPD